MNHNTNSNLRLTDDSGGDTADRAIEATLDQLGRAERSSASPTLEGRVLAATQALLAKTDTREAAPVISHAGSWSWGLRIAAAITVVVCAGAAWLAVRPSAPAVRTATVVTALAEDVDALIMASSFADAGVADELVKLDADTLNFGQSSASQDWLDAIEDTSL